MTMLVRRLAGFVVEHDLEAERAVIGDAAAAEEAGAGERQAVDGKSAVSGVQERHFGAGCLIVIFEAVVELRVRTEYSFPLPEVQLLIELRRVKRRFAAGERQRQRADFAPCVALERRLPDAGGCIE